jgi:site-specific recombinase XerD
MTRSGIEHRLAVVRDLASRKDATLGKIHLSPHTIRHTTAMHLLQSGVDLSVIAMWLGHEDLETTHKYLDADLETKKRALDRLPSPAARRLMRKRQPRVVDFLRRL